MVGITIPSGDQLNMLSASAARMASKLTPTNSPPPEDPDQKLVQTPFGKGLVVRTRSKDGIREIVLFQNQDGDLATEASMSRLNRRKHKMTLYTTQDYPSIPPTVGDDVLAPFGRGRIMEIRQQATTDSNGTNDPPNDDPIVHVRLSSWRLANRSLVNCFVTLSSVTLVRAKEPKEMTTYEKIRLAQELKQSAAKHFAAKENEAALRTYSRAVETVRNVQHGHDSNNHLRADLVVVMITCCNNAGTCCVRLQQWDEAMQFAQSARLLLVALENKKGLRIHTILTKEDGISNAKIFGEWLIKTFLIQGKAYMEKKRYEEALNTLQQTDKILREYGSNLTAQEKEVKRLIALCTQKRKHERKLEKKRAQAMFGGKSSKNGTNITSARVVDAATLSSGQASSNGSAAAKPYLATMNGGAMKDKKGVSFRTELEEHRGIEARGEAPFLAKSTVTKQQPSTKEEENTMNTRNRTANGKGETEDGEEEESWLEEHKEALILFAAGVAAMGMIFLRSK